MIKDNKVCVDPKQFRSLLEKYALEEKKVFWKKIGDFNSLDEAKKSMSDYVVSNMLYEDKVSKDINLQEEKIEGGTIIYTFEEARSYQIWSRPKETFFSKHRFRIKPYFVNEGKKK